jgi:hypothetical protein
VDDIDRYRDPLVNGHINFIDTDANGYGLANVTESDISVQLITINDINLDPSVSIPQIKYAAKFTISKTPNGNGVDLVGPSILGEKPFPYS